MGQRLAPRATNLTTANLIWLWRTFREEGTQASGVACGVLIAAFAIMAGVRSWGCNCPGSSPGRPGIERVSVSGTTVRVLARTRTGEAACCGFVKSGRAGSPSPRGRLAGRSRTRVDLSWLPVLRSRCHRRRWGRERHLLGARRPFLSGSPIPHARVPAIHALSARTLRYRPSHSHSSNKSIYLPQCKNAGGFDRGRA